MFTAATVFLQLCDSFIVCVITDFSYIVNLVTERSILYMFYMSMSTMTVATLLFNLLSKLTVSS